MIGNQRREKKTSVIITSSQTTLKALCLLIVKPFYVVSGCLVCPIEYTGVNHFQDYVIRRPCFGVEVCYVGSFALAEGSFSMRAALWKDAQSEELKLANNPRV